MQWQRAQETGSRRKPARLINVNNPGHSRIAWLCVSAVSSMESHSSRAKSTSADNANTPANVVRAPRGGPV